MHVLNSRTRETILLIFPSRKISVNLSLSIDAFSAFYATYTYACWSYCIITMKKQTHIYTIYHYTHVRHIILIILCFIFKNIFLLFYFLCLVAIRRRCCPCLLGATSPMRADQNAAITAVVLHSVSRCLGNVGTPPPSPALSSSSVGSVLGCFKSSASSSFGSKPNKMSIITTNPQNVAFQG